MVPSCRKARKLGQSPFRGNVRGNHSWASPLGEGTSAFGALSCGPGTTLQGASSADPTCTATPALGAASTTTGTLTLASSSSTNSTTLQPTPSPTSAVTLTGVPVTSTLEGTASAQNTGSDTVTCNTSETDFTTTYTIPANFIVANRVLRITWLGRMTTASSSPPGMAFNLKLGTTSVFTASTALPPAASLSNAPVGIVFYVQGTAAAGGSVNVFTNPALPSPTDVPFSKSSVNQPVALATNGSLAVKPGLVCASTSASNSLTTDQLIVEATN